jgi:hypothetical protein
MLAVFQYGHDGSPHSKRGSIKGVDQFGPAHASFLKSNASPPGLEIFKIAARRYLPVKLLSRQPYLQVIRLGCRETKISGAKGNHSVRKLQPFQYFFSIFGELFKFIIRILRLTKLDQLNLIELMLADQASCILAI